MYTCLFEANRDGKTCFDPLFYYYPYDEKAYDNIEESIIVGGALKVSPILTPGVKDTYEAYFPAGKWASMIDHTEIIEGGKMAQLKARKTVNVHVRPGSLFPYQDNTDHSITLTN